MFFFNWDLHLSPKAIPKESNMDLFRSLQNWIQHVCEYIFVFFYNPNLKVLEKFCFESIHLLD